MLHDLIISLFINIRNEISVAYLFLIFFYNYDYLLLIKIF